MLAISNQIPEVCNYHDLTLTDKQIIYISKLKLTKYYYLYWETSPCTPVWSTVNFQIRYFNYGPYSARSFIGSCVI